MGMVAEIIEASKNYGREFVLLVIVMSAFGLGSKLVYESLNARMIQQDARIEASDHFIRDKLSEMNASTVDALNKTTSALKENARCFESNARALEGNTKALIELNRRNHD